MRFEFLPDVLTPNLSFCRSLRSCDMDVLYHGSASGSAFDSLGARSWGETRQAASLRKNLLKLPRARPTVLRRWTRTVASQLHRPPLRRQAKGAETPLGGPHAARPEGEGCECRHKELLDCESAPVARSAPNARIQSGRHR